MPPQEDFRPALSEGSPFKIQIVQSTLLYAPDQGTGERQGLSTLVFPELPENLVLSKSATYNDEVVPGRTEPWKSYSSSEPTRVSFTVRFLAQGEPKSRGLPLAIAGGGLSLANRFGPEKARPFLGIAGNAIGLAASLGKQNDVLQVTFFEVHLKVAFLESLVYAQYDAFGRAYPPPKVQLIYGQNFDFTGVVRSVSFVYRGPWEIESLLCMLVEASIEFEESNPAPKGYLEVQSREVPRRTGKDPGLLSGQLAIDAARSAFGL
jgi:hypothetical protein